MSLPLIVLIVYGMVALAFLFFVIYAFYDEWYGDQKKKIAEKEKEKILEQRELGRAEEEFCRGLERPERPEVIDELEKLSKVTGDCPTPQCIQPFELRKVAESREGWQVLPPDRIEHAGNCEFCRILINMPENPAQ